MRRPNPAGKRSAAAGPPTQLLLHGHWIVEHATRMCQVQDFVGNDVEVGAAGGGDVGYLGKLRRMWTEDGQIGAHRLAKNALNFNHTFRIEHRTKFNDMTGAQTDEVQTGCRKFAGRGRPAGARAAAGSRSALSPCVHP